MGLAAAFLGAGLDAGAGAAAFLAGAGAGFDSALGAGAAGFDSALAAAAAARLASAASAAALAAATRSACASACACLMASALAAFSAAAASAAAADAAWRSASRALASALASTGGPVGALGTDAAAGAGASDAAGASGSGAGAGAARLGVGYALGAGASSWMPAFFLIFFTAAASWEVTVSRHAEEGHLDRWLSNCAVTCAICSSTGERASSAMDGAATYGRGHGGDGVRRRSGIKIEIVIHWNILHHPSFDAGTKASGRCDGNEAVVSEDAPRVTRRRRTRA